MTLLESTDAADAAAPVETTPTLADRVRGRLVEPMPTDRRAGWIATLAVTLLAAVIRFWRLDQPKGYVFDEVYYAKDSLSLLMHGVELDNNKGGPGFVVHPPLGKWMIAVGEWLFGGTYHPGKVDYHGVLASNPELGYRFSAAVAGTVVVLLMVRIARRMFRSTLLGVVAGLLMTFEALEFVQSRTSMLDIFLMLWVTAAFACLLVDRDQVRSRLAQRVTDGPDPDVVAPTGLGPSVGVRWWLAAGGLCLGAACATKWTGIFFLVAFALLVLIWDGSARRAARVRRPRWSALVRSVPQMSAWFFALPAMTYMLSWSGWLLTSTGWDRQYADTNPCSALTRLLPSSLRSLLHYHAEILSFHMHLETHHTYQSHPEGWLFLARPVSYFYTSPKLGEMGCKVATCSREVLGIGSPAIFWGGAAALVAVLWWWVSRRDWRAMAIVIPAVIGVGAWIPSDQSHRTMFLFYVLPVVPFLVLALTLCAGWALGGPAASDTRRLSGTIAVGVGVALAVVNFVYLYPILAAWVIPYSSWQDRMWFPSWI